MDSSSEPTMTERVKALGAYDGPTDPVAVIRDMFRVASTLIQTDDYCWCQTFPCECIAGFMDDLAECLETRYPELAEARRAETEGQP